MREKWNFHLIWIVMEKLLVKWAPGTEFFSPTIHSIVTVQKNFTFIKFGFKIWEYRKYRNKLYFHLLMNKFEIISSHISCKCLFPLNTFFSNRNTPINEYYIFSCHPPKSAPLKQHFSVLVPTVFNRENMVSLDIPKRQAGFKEMPYILKRNSRSIWELLKHWRVHWSVEMSIVTIGHLLYWSLSARLTVTPVR